MTSSLSSLPSGRFRPPMIPCFSMLSFFFKFGLLYSSLIIQSSIFFLVFSFLIYNPFFLLLFLFEVSPLSLLCPIQSRCLVLIIVNRDLSSSTCLKPHLICALSNLYSPSYVTSSFQRLPILWCPPFSKSLFLHSTRSHFKSVFSPFFSILPLVILSSWKRLLSHCYPGSSILVAEGRDPQILGRGGPREGRRGVVGVVDGS